MNLPAFQPEDSFAQEEVLNYKLHALTEIA
ncbi:MAG: hypothetical protein FD147_987 [Chloroflexi bacterium]|nr:MAG: hypothetical protein FD147_987 [Chloroflexota bacterium]